jgi:hypothetical protein
MITVIVDGIAYGLLLFVLSVGLSITLGLMNFVNLAHGAFAMAGGYVTVILVNQAGVPFLPSLGAAFVVAALIGGALERTLFCNRAARVKGSKLAPAPRPVVWQGPLFCPRSAHAAAASWSQARARRINLRGCAVAERMGSFGHRGGFVDVTAAPRPCRTLPPERNSWSGRDR